MCSVLPAKRRTKPRSTVGIRSVHLAATAVRDYFYRADRTHRSAFLTNSLPRLALARMFLGGRHPQAFRLSAHMWRRNIWRQGR